VIENSGGPAWDADGFERLRATVRDQVADEFVPMLKRLAGILALAHDIEIRLQSLTNVAALESVADARAHLERLIRPGFVSATGRDNLASLDRYLRALAIRVEAIGTEPTRDRLGIERVRAVAAEVDRTLALIPAALAATPEPERIRQMLEEFRVSVFAQRIGTAYPISEQRIWKALDRLSDAR
jgi:ATP-dependent helicase HrpA